MTLSAPTYPNSNESDITISFNNVLDGDLVGIYSKLRLHYLIQSGTVASGTISFSISGVADGANTYYFNVTDLNSNVGGCIEGITLH